MPRKNKRRRRFRPKSRYRRRSMRRMGGNRPEIKFVTLVGNDLALKLDYRTVASSGLEANQYYVANIFSNIPVGTSYTQRIGTKIFVMSITVKFLVYGCPSSTDYVADRFQMRHMWFNSRSSAGTAIPGFWGDIAKVQYNGFINRKEFTVHKDKHFMVSPGAFATASTGSSANSGGVRNIEYSIPVNKYVSYSADGFVREDKNVYSLAMLIAAPGLDATSTGRQYACGQLKIRIYYKDA
jgi:hypothetical protein